MLHQRSVRAFRSIARAIGTWGFAVGLAACGGSDSTADREAHSGVTTSGGAALEDGSYDLGPVDHGSGSPPVVGTRSAAAAPREVAAAAAISAPEVSGRFMAAFAWPLIPLHLALLPDGRV